MNAPALTAVHLSGEARHKGLRRVGKDVVFAAQLRGIAARADRGIPG
ncbi:hypothetical protein [Bradyrhizobium macuxiense]|nr:hypothetical protein [Bradyrhizobium macuxiense]